MADITALHQTSALLGWDQQTYMPTMGAQSRAMQMEVVSKLAHQMQTDPMTERLIFGAESETSDLDPESDECAYIRIVRKDFEKSAKVPVELVADMAKTTALAHEAWAKARAEDNYQTFAPWLSRILDLTKRLAEHLGYEERIYDALLDQYEPDMLTSEVESMFSALKPRSVELIRKIREFGDPSISDEILRRHFDPEKQKQFGEQIVQDLGFRSNCGRQDPAVHPFCTTIGTNDVRITTRYEENWLPAALFGSIHETGHALYELGISHTLSGNALGTASSLGVHESQSRFWENLIGRSEPFWQRYYPKLQQTFPDSLGSVDLSEFFRSINKVTPSLIRVEADELTYNMHTLLRFELENDLLEGDLTVEDAPDAWNAKMEEYLGVMPPSDRLGILQDVHWSSGGIGYFPTYSIGNILSVQLWNKMDSDLGHNTNDLILKGDFVSIVEWLRTNIHQWGRRYSPTELTKRITGEGLNALPYLNYLEQKFGKLYGV